MKVLCVSDAIRIASQSSAELEAGDGGDSEPTEAYSHVECDMDDDPWLQVHRLFHVVAGKKLSSMRFRRFVTQAGIVSGSLASHEADLLYQKLKDMGNMGEVTGMELGALLLDVAAKKHSDMELSEAFAALMEQIAAAYPEIVE